MALDLFILADCGTADRVAANLTLLKWPSIVKFSWEKRALYVSAIKLFGRPIWRPKLSARRKKDYATKVSHCTSECFSYHF